MSDSFLSVTFSILFLLSSPHELKLHSPGSLDSRGRKLPVVQKQAYSTICQTPSDEMCAQPSPMGMLRISVYLNCSVSTNQSQRILLCKAKEAELQTEITATKQAGSRWNARLVPAPQHSRTTPAAEKVFHLMQ